MLSRIYFFSIFICLTFGWGYIGHDTTAYLAYNWLTDETKTYLLDTYNITSRDQFVATATWADTVKETPKYGWSYELHFVDVNTDPPQNCPNITSDDKYLVLPRNRCALNYTLDCVDNRCIIGAVSNYTARYLTMNDFDSLQFLIHFMGDIFQPFHISYRIDLGGNRVKILYNGVHTNLHSIWDSEMIDTYVYSLGGIDNYYRNISEYAKDIIPKIKNNPLEIAQFGLSTICEKHLYCDIYGSIGIGSTISREYYEKNIEIIKERLSMSGFFTAAIINQRGKSHML